MFIFNIQYNDMALTDWHTTEKFRPLYLNSFNRRTIFLNKKIHHFVLMGWTRNRFKIAIISIFMYIVITYILLLFLLHLYLRMLWCIMYSHIFVCFVYSFYHQEQ